MPSVERTEPPRPPRLRGLRYLGGHPAAPDELDRIDMTFDDVGVRFERHGHVLGVVVWDDVVDLAADTTLTTERMTVPRVLVFGIYAALFKRRDRHVLLRLQDRRGAWVFEVDGITLHELRAGIDAIHAAHLV